MAGLALIINTRAFGNQRDWRRPSRFAKIIGSSGHLAATRSPEELGPICAQLERMRPEVVAICGGDGTLHHTLTALLRAYRDAPLPRIAILRGGALNVVADSLGIRGSVTATVRELVRSAAGAAMPRLEAFGHPLLQVGERFGFLFGTGLVHSFLERYYATGRPCAATAGRLLLRAIASGFVDGSLSRHIYRPFHVQLIADGTPWPYTRFVALGAATVEQIGLGFRPFYRCREQSDQFAVLGIDATPLGLVRELPRIRAGKPIRRHKALDGVARELVIAPLDPSPLGYMVDGELYTCEHTLTVRLGPALTFLRLRST